MMTCTSLWSGMASSGVRVSAQIPPATPKTLRMMTRNGLRALASIMRSSRNGFFCVIADVEPVAVSMRLFPLALPGLKRALHLRFGVDEEVGTGDDALGFVEAGFDLVVIAELAAQLDKARLQSTLAFVHENDIPLAGGQHGADGQGHPFA